jgi:hypothetical protein
MQRVTKHFYRALSLSIIANLIFPTGANADTTVPEIISVKEQTTDIFVGKKWTGAYFEVVVKDESTIVKLSKVVLKSTNSQRKDIPCYDVDGLVKTISGDLFAHQANFSCAIPKKTDAPDIRFIQFTATDGAGFSSTYTTDTFNAKVNFISGFDPKLIEKAQTDTGKLQLVQECTSYEQARLSTLDIHKTVAKFPAGNPFETKYKEGKTALSKPFNCNLGSDLLTRASDYEDLVTRLAIGLGEALNYQVKLLEEKVNSLKATSITCIKGKTSKVVKGVNPKCPAGYKKK